MQHIRTRIEDYAAFGRQTIAWLDEQKKAKPELAAFITEMQTLTHRIDEAVERRKDKIQPAERAAELVDEFRKNVLNDESAGALDACKKLTAGCVGIGGAQDELVGECRAAVKVLRQRAALAMAVDPRTAAVAKELRSRTQTMLRNPTSYEAPRH
jgi:hypothetical protein